MAITELRYGGKTSYNVEFISKIPKDKIVLLLHKTHRELYLVTGCFERVNIPHISITPLCSIDKRKNRYNDVVEMALFDDYEVIALESLYDFKNIVNLEFCE